MNIKKYVAVDDLLKHKRKMRGFGLSSDEEFWDVAVLVEDINNTPAADLEEVVRCKDCKEFYKGKCELVLGLPNPYPDSFCSFGKKRNVDEQGA